MDGISGVASRYSYDNLWGFSQAEKTAPTAAKTESQAGPAAASSRLATEPASLVRPSLLVAVQESDVVRESGDSEEETNGLFAVAEETEEDRLIAEILEKGLVDWAHEKWLEKIREKARQSALSEMGLTENDLASLSPEMQEQIERMIAEKVDEAIRSALDDAAKENGEHQKADAMVVSPIITGG